MSERRIQYTVRKVPEAVDAAARKRAAETGQSLNQVLVEALERGLHVTDEPVRNADFDDLIGTWVDDPAFDKVIEEMDRVDPELWK